MNVVVLPSAGRQKWWGTNTAVLSEAWAKLREWAILAGKGRLLLSGSVVLASLKAAVYCWYLNKSYHIVCPLVWPSGAT